MNRQLQNSRRVAATLLRTLGAAFRSAGRYGSGIASCRRISRSALFHRLGVLVALVIVADQMQESMHGKMGDMMGERLALVAGLARDGLVGEHDVAESWPLLAAGVLGRKRQHVRGRIDAAPIPVEQADRRIIGQNDSKLGRRLLTAWRRRVRRRAARPI